MPTNKHKRNSGVRKAQWMLKPVHMMKNRIHSLNISPCNYLLINSSCLSQENKNGYKHLANIVHYGFLKKERKETRGDPNIEISWVNWGTVKDNSMPPIIMMLYYT